MIVDLKESGEKCGTKDEIIVQNISDEVKVEEKQASLYDEIEQSVVIDALSLENQALRDEIPQADPSVVQTEARFDYETVCEELSAAPTPQKIDISDPAEKDQQEEIIDTKQEVQVEIKDASGVEVSDNDLG